jgi:cytochrome c oxidase subunit 2
MMGVVVYFLTSAATAQMYARGSDDALPGDDLYAICSFCHAPEGQGSQRLDAPALAGMEAWYVERQLHNFRNRIRGMHPDDVTGLQMSIVSGMPRNDATIASVAAYIESMDPNVPPETYDGEPMGTGRPYVWHSPYAEFTSPEPGDAARGGQLYSTTCLICHGAAGEGNQALGAPKLTELQNWYQARQVKYFRDGLRGADPQDTYGAQMAAMSKMLTTDQAIADVIAYINTL